MPLRSWCIRIFSIKIFSNGNINAAEETTDDILSWHEEMLSKWEDKLAEAKPILKLYEERKSLRNQKIQLEQSSADPKRLLDTKKSATFLLQ